MKRRLALIMAGVALIGSVLAPAAFASKAYTGDPGTCTWDSFGNGPKSNGDQTHTLDQKC